MKIPSIIPALTTIRQRLLPGIVFEEEDLQKVTLMCGVSSIGIFFLAMLGILAFLQGGILLGIFDFLSACLLAALLYLLRFKFFLKFSFYAGAAVAFCLYTYLFITGGVAGNAFLWSYTLPLIGFFLLGRKNGLLISLLYLLICSVILLVDLTTPLINLYDIYFTQRFIPSFITVTLFSLIYEEIRENSLSALIKSKNNLEREVDRRTNELRQEVKEKDEAQYQAMLAKEEWERTFDAVPEQICILDKKYRIIRANRTMAEALNRPFHELINHEFHAVVQGLDAPSPDCLHTKLLQDQQVHTGETFDANAQRYYITTVSPLYDGAGNFFGSVRIARDITEEKKAEEEKIAVKEKLRRAEKMEAIGLMAGGVAHDLNNILSGIVSYPEVLLRKLPKDDAMYASIELIKNSGERAAAVVDDLLTVARGVIKVKETASLNAIIQEYFDSTEFKKLSQLHPEVTINSSLQPNLHNITCSPIHIQKALMNLITNAVESIELRGNVTIQTANKTIGQQQNEIVQLEAGEYVTLTVRDSGAGIPEQDISRIFEPFFTKKVMGRSGTGLGLAVVWNIVEDHGATIHVESGESGTTFIIYFTPCLGLANEEEIIDADSMQYQGEGSILIVDDLKEQRDIASQILETFGYDVETVASGEEAVNYCRTTEVDLLLLDMIMDPGLNGLETYKKIIETHPGQKALIASGFSESDDVKAALQLGAGGFIKKPYSMNQLGKAVKELLAT